MDTRSSLRRSKDTSLRYFLDPDSTQPLFEQLSTQVRDDILAGRLGRGERLPSSRTWAVHLGLSRTTVLTALDQLRAEGYIESARSSAVRVTRTLPEDALRRPANARVGPAAQRAKPIAPANTITWPAPRNHGAPHAFQLAVPALDRFPCREWSRVAARIWRKPPLALLNYPQPGGYPPLRRAIAEYLSFERGVRCEPEQVVITAGSQQALHLAAQVLLKPCSGVWMENPGYYAARLAFERAGARVHAVRVDAEGIDVEAGIRKAPDAAMAYVTPSHQCPLGCRLSLDRRLALLRWAGQAGAWLIEDDYDSEFRYTGRPLAPLHALDGGRCVLYVGSFSLALCPALRLGYMVAPPAVVDAFLSARALADWNSPAVDQAVLAEFIGSGMLARHLRRMRALYSERQQELISEVGRKLGDWMRMEPQAAGLHVPGWLGGISEARVMRVANDAGVELRPMSMYHVGKAASDAVLFGFAPFDAAAIRDGVTRLQNSLRHLPMA
jgi:GntR family transcriptional regulator/MocR family aminotransferase